MGRYDESMRLRAIDGINAHGSLDLYLSDFRACAKLFEMYVADHLTRKFDCRDRPFLLWEDIDHETKEARGLTGADTGVDVTDGVTTIVQCKLRSRAVTWGECATFFGSAVAYDATAAAYSVPVEEPASCAQCEQRSEPAPSSACEVAAVRHADRDERGLRVLHEAAIARLGAC